MCPSGVMFPSEVMCASRVRMRNTSHHFATKGSKTSLWRSHNITAACRNITLYKRSKLCYNIYRRRGAIMAESKLRELSMEFSVDIIHLTNQGFSPFSRWHLFCQHVPSVPVLKDAGRKTRDFLGFFSFFAVFRYFACEVRLFSKFEFNQE